MMGAGFPSWHGGIGVFKKIGAWAVREKRIEKVQFRCTVSVAVWCAVCNGTVSCSGHGMHQG